MTQYLESFKLFLVVHLTILARKEHVAAVCALDDAIRHAVVRELTMHVA